MNYETFSEYNDVPLNYNKNIYETKNKKNNNGEINKIDENNTTIEDIYKTPFLFIQEHRKNYKNIVSTALKGVQRDSELSKLYFSDKNINRIQKMIKKTVYKKTNGKYKLDVDQDINDLVIVMRAVYIEYGRYIPGQIVRQCKNLNNKVIDEIVPGIITQIKQYYGYLKEINKPLEPIARPLNVNNAGRKTLPSVTNVWDV